MARQKVLLFGGLLDNPLDNGTAKNIMDLFMAMFKANMHLINTDGKFVSPLLNTASALSIMGQTELIERDLCTNYCYAFTNCIKLYERKTIMVVENRINSALDTERPAFAIWIGNLQGEPYSSIAKGCKARDIPILSFPVCTPIPLQSYEEIVKGFEAGKYFTYVSEENRQKVSTLFDRLSIGHDVFMDLMKLLCEHESAYA